MLGREKRIHLIWTQAQDELAASIMELVEREFGPLRTSTNRFATFDSEAAIHATSAIVLCEDTAIDDPLWQEHVRDLPDGVRIIPIGSFRFADVNRSDEVPAKVSDIQCLRIDEHLFDHLKDSLTTSSDFYELQNTVSIAATAWEAYDRDEDMLMPGFLATSRALKTVRKKMQSESDELYREQLATMERFLSASRKRNVALLKRARLPIALGCFCVVVAILGIGPLLSIMPAERQADASLTVLEQRTSAQDASVRALHTADGLTNPYVADFAKLELYNEFVDDMGMAWPNTPIGYLLPADDDIMLGDTSRFVRIGEDDGSITTWDTHSGEETASDPVADTGILACEASLDGALEVVVDYEGGVYARLDGGPWLRSDEPCEIDGLSKSRIAISESDDRFAVFNDSGVALYAIEDATLGPLFAETFQTLRAVDLGEGATWTAYIEENGDFLARTYDGSSPLGDEPIPVHPLSSCSLDTLNGQLAIADESGRVIIRRSDGTLRELSFELQEPMFLDFLDGRFLACNDLNSGTHIYDIEHDVELGTCLENATFVSRLKAQGTTIAAFSLGSFYTQDIEELLPLQQVDIDLESVFSGIDDSGSGDLIRGIAIEAGNLPIIRLNVNGRSESKILSASASCLSDVSQPNLDLDGTLLVNTTLSPQIGFEGDITLAKVTRELPTGEEAIAIGTSQGEYREFLIAADGTVSLAAKKDLPCRSAVRSVVFDGDAACYIVDDDGQAWKVRLGIPPADTSGMLSQIGEKLTEQPDDLSLAFVSDEALESAGIHVPEWYDLLEQEL